MRGTVTAAPAETLSNPFPFDFDNGDDGTLSLAKIIVKLSFHGRILLARLHRRLLPSVNGSGSIHSLHTGVNGYRLLWWMRLL